MYGIVFTEKFSQRIMERIRENLSKSFFVSRYHSPACVLEGSSGTDVGK